MTETAAQETAVATPVKTPKKKLTAPKAKGAKSAPTSHPPTAQMVNNAIKNLKERGKCNNSSISTKILNTINSELDINTKVHFCEEICLIAAVKKGCIKDIELLMRYKADLNVKDFGKKTALIWAAIEGNIDAAKL